MFPLKWGIVPVFPCSRVPVFPLKWEIVPVFPLKWEIVPVFPAHLRNDDGLAFPATP